MTAQLEGSSDDNSGSKYRILINDYAGHPFQVQLSRWLAVQGHEVLHTYCSSVQTPRGELEKQLADAVGFEIEGISVGRKFNKYGLVSRWRQELALGEALVRSAARFQPDVIVSANTPLGAQRKLATYANGASVPFIFWLQDVLGYGIRRALHNRLLWFGDLIGRYFEVLERDIWRDSDHIVTITCDFSSIVQSAGVEPWRVTTIHNWAPLEELPLRERDNAWSRHYGLSDKRCFLYSGTLGLKHNPGLLIELAEAFRHREDVRIVVNSEGQGAEYLRREKGLRGLDNLLLLGFQAFDQMADVLASGDVLVTLLEPTAGRFAVPSKVTTYLCAKRPLLLAVPRENLAGRIVQEAKAGVVVSPGDPEGFVAAALELMGNEKGRNQMAANGRAYAEATFDISRIGKRFEKIIMSTTRQ